MTDIDSSYCLNADLKDSLVLYSTGNTKYLQNRKLFNDNIHRILEHGKRPIICSHETKDVLISYDSNGRQEFKIDSWDRFYKLRKAKIYSLTTNSNHLNRFLECYIIVLPSDLDHITNTLIDMYNKIGDDGTDSTTTAASVGYFYLIHSFDPDSLQFLKQLGYFELHHPKALKKTVVFHKRRLSSSSPWEIVEILDDVR